MRSRPLAALAGLVVFAGCGGVGDTARQGDSRRCPEGVGEVGVKEILPEPPAGTRLVATDGQVAAPFKSTMRDELGDGLRSVDSRTVVKRGRDLGVVVFAVNAAERLEARGVMAGAEDSADEFGGEPQKMTIAGDDGAISSAATASWRSASSATAAR